MTDASQKLSAGSARLSSAFASYGVLSSDNLSYNPASLSGRQGAGSTPTNPDSSFKGHASNDIADALAKYAKSHASDGNDGSFKSSLLEAPASTAPALLAASSASAGAASAAALSTSSTSDPAFSIAALMSHSYGFRVVYSIVWITLGVFLMFFGLASFYWATSPRLSPKRGKTSRRVLGGGIGGMVVGFLSGSFLSLIITGATATRHHTTLSAGGTFALFMAPGCVLLAASAHLRFLSRLLTGLLGGVCAAVILTATFGVHAIVPRSILLAIFCVLLTAPLLAPAKARWPRTKKWLLNINTSLVGSVCLMDGVALFAPPEEASRSWIDLWTLLFAPDGSSTQTYTVRSWGSSAFKGYIAGAVLSALVSVAFEAWFHREAGESVEDEWNEYLGAYTNQIEKGELLYAAEAGDGGPHRAGRFQEPQSLWSKLRHATGDASAWSRRQRGPASYGNIAEGRSAPEAGGFTERAFSGRRSGGRGRQSSGTGPARFEALSKKDRSRKLSHLVDSDFDSGDSDSEATEIDELEKQAECRDVVTALPKTTNYGGYALPVLPALPRPPSYRTDSAQSSSQLSGSTAVSSSGSSHTQPRPDAGDRATVQSREGSAAKGTEDVHRPTSVYRDASKNSAAAVASATTKSGRQASAQTTTPVAATPSLINAIDRIQRAQAQARLWQAQHGEPHLQEQPAPYGKQSDGLED
ncbi:unnamed protein product [Parajaminaea phylloscopi]